MPNNKVLFWVPQQVHVNIPTDQKGVVPLSIYWSKFGIDFSAEGLVWSALLEEAPSSIWPCPHHTPSCALYFAGTHTDIPTAAGGLDPIRQCGENRMCDWCWTLGEQTLSLGAKWFLAQSQRIRVANQFGASSSIHQRAMPFLSPHNPCIVCHIKLFSALHCYIQGQVLSSGNVSNINFESSGNYSHTDSEQMSHSMGRGRTRE